MSVLSRRFKLEYNDAVDGTTVIAETGQDTGALKIDRHVQIRRQKDPDILKLWLEGSNFGEAIPTRKSEFGQAQNGTDEPEILYKQYDPDTDSFVTQGRYYAKNTGTIDENGNLALKLYSFHKFTARQSVDTGTTTTNVEDALNDVLPTGYVADVPTGATPPSVDGYSINARREKGYHELTRDYKWTLTFTGELDGSNNYLVKYEPEGFGGTVDTIIENTQAGRYNIIDVDTTNEVFTVSGDRTQELVVNQAILVTNSTGNDGTFTVNNLSYNPGNNETNITVNENVTNSTADGAVIPGGQAVFKAWEKDKTDAIINKVTVEGTSTSTGNTITGTATNQTQIDNFGEKFLKVKRGYVESVSDAENIAEGYLVPGLDDNGNDITKVPENGTVKTTAYSDNVVNDSFQVVGNKRNIDDTYTVAQQRNFWPEGATEIEFEFEQENLEEAARDAENLRDERGRLYPNQQTDVGGQTIDQSQSNTTTASADNSTTEDDQSPDTNGSTGNPFGDNDYDFSQAVFDSASSTFTEVTCPSLNLGVEYYLVHFHVDLLDASDTSPEFDITIENTDTNNTLFDERIAFIDDSTGSFGTISFTVIERESADFDTIRGELTEVGTFTFSGTFTLTVDAVGNHDHITSGNTDAHAHNVDTNDLGHGDTTDPSTHELQGQTEEGQNINVANEEKTDR